MSSKKYFLLFLLFLTGTGHRLHAHFGSGKTGVGISAGSSTYIGDLDYNFPIRFARPGIGIHFISGLFPRMDIRLAYFHGWLGASDSKSNSKISARGLSFRSNVDELSLAFRFRVFNQKNVSGHPRRIEPYIFGGFAFFHFNPQASFNGEYYDLQPLGTEGQYLKDGSHPAPYALWQWAIPMGGGFEKMISENWQLGVETGFRKLFTDYLDDVSGSYPDPEKMLAQQGTVAAGLSDPSDRSVYPSGRYGYNRGESSNMDWYVYTNIHLTYFFHYEINKRGGKKHRANKNSLNCPGMK